VRLRDLLNYIDARNTGGATFDEIKQEFGDVEPDDISRLLSSALDLSEIKKDGKGRGVRYYGINYDIVKIKNDGFVPQVDNAKFIDGHINVSKCATVKEKIRTILASDHKLSKPFKFTYREKISGNENGKELHDFIISGIRDIDVGVHFDFKTQKNVQYCATERCVYNSLWIGCIDGLWTIKMIFNGMTDRPDIREFDNFVEFEKCLRTLLTK